MNARVWFATVIGAVFFCGMAGAGEGEQTYDVNPGDEWQLDWSWREVKVPLFA